MNSIEESQKRKSHKRRYEEVREVRGQKMQVGALFQVTVAVLLNDIDVWIH